MLSLFGSPSKTCDGVTRRAFLQAAGPGLLGLTLPKLLLAEQNIDSVGFNDYAPKAKSVIFLFLFGGPSQLETFDMKPESARETRGPFQPIPCKTPGLLMCEHLPKLAKISDKFSILRNLSHTYNDHSGAAHYIQTGM